jgi:hypothetical protein
VRRDNISSLFAIISIINETGEKCKEFFAVFFVVVVVVGREGKTHKILWFHDRDQK